MNTSSHSNPSRALVLGGGGSTGNAWLIGVVAGLAEAGVDVTGADLTIGTSAGATAAAQLAGAAPAELYEATLTAPSARQLPPGGPNRTGAVVDHLQRTADIIAAAQDPADLRRRMGASALELAAGSDHTARWRSVVAARLPAPDWPANLIRLSAVHARTGEPAVFDRYSGVELVDAIAASTSGGPAYRIGDDWFIDGGYRTNAENADLAAGYGTVLVLSPFGGRTRTPDAWHLGLATQVAELRANGSAVHTISPGAASEHLFGPRGMDPTLRPDAARAGRERGLAVAAEVAALWS